MKDNKLIAEFMGVPCDKDLYTPLCPHTGETLFIPSSQMKYDTSWDWLMPVVEEIKNMSGQGVLMMELGLPIEHVYERVVQFIKEHKKYPFNEGDDYWSVEDGELVWGVWDDVSEEMHDENPNREYFTEEEAVDYARANGIKYKG